MVRRKRAEVIVLNGSPRPRGNTSVLLEWLQQELRRRGWTVRGYDLYRMRFAGCAHCDSCKKVARRPGCRLQDDLLPVLEGIVHAPVVVMASPVYCWKVSGCLAAALDRFYSLFKDGGSLIAGKRVAGVFSAGGDAFDGMDLCVETLRRICDYGGAEYAGTLGAVLCDTPQALRRDTRLRHQVRQLVDDLTAG